MASGHIQTEYNYMQSCREQFSFDYSKSLFLSSFCVPWQMALLSILFIKLLSSFSLKQDFFFIKRQKFLHSFWLTYYFVTAGIQDWNRAVIHFSQQGEHVLSVWDSNLVYVIQNLVLKENRFEWDRNINVLICTICIRCLFHNVWFATSNKGYLIWIYLKTPVNS